MKRKRQRKCKGCEDLYKPDPRTQFSQTYCSSHACQLASKAASQRRWLSRKENSDYFRGKENVARVQAWRRDNPGYWRRKRLKESALQEMILPQPVGSQADSDKLTQVALQEMICLQPTVVLGLISKLTGDALQDEIALTVRKLHTRGQEILGMVSGIKTRGGSGHDRETGVVLAANASRAKAVQLD